MNEFITAVWAGAEHEAAHTVVTVEDHPSPIGSMLRFRERLKTNTEDNMANSTTAIEPSTGSEMTIQDEEKQRRNERADELIAEAAKWAAGVGLVPIPLLSITGVMGIHVGLVKKLAELHGLKVSDHRAKTLIGAVVASTGGMTGGRALVQTALNVIPGVRWFSALAAGPGGAAAATYLIGKSFHRHFESGGTIDTFDAARHTITDVKDKVKSTVKDKKMKVQDSNFKEKVKNKASESYKACKELVWPSKGSAESEGAAENDETSAQGDESLAESGSEGTSDKA